MAKIAFNGRFLTKGLTGQERFASELLMQLDKICKKGEFCVVTSENALTIPKYQNIEVIQTGKLKREAWEQFCLGPYLSKHKMKCVNLTTTFPLFHCDVVCLHDANNQEMGKEFMKTLYGFFGTLWKRLLFFIARFSAKKILTVSYFSKSKLHDVCGFKSEKIHVVYNAWQHYERIVPDAGIQQKLPESVKEGNYYFALSSLSPQKNFIWIKEIAKRNPHQQFVVTGKAEGFTKLGSEDLTLDNLHFTGYLSDGEIKWLMQHCKAFVHPSIYEGFGIPPLEAMACGAEIIISNYTCLPEIYGESAHYFDPYDYTVNLDEKLKEKVAPRELVLEKYSWAKEAEKLYHILTDTEL